MVRRDLKKADDEISDATNRNGYKASVVWVPGQGRGRPMLIQNAARVNPDAAGRSRHVLPREISRPVQNTGLPQKCAGWAVKFSSPEKVAIETILDAAD